MTYALDPFSIGFERINTMLMEAQKQAIKTVTYPPYNIRKANNSTDDVYIVEMAVAGFGRQDIEITLEGNTLKIQGNVKETPEDEKNYVFRGIAARSFSRTFTLADTVEIKNAEIINGMLRIWLDNMIPDKKSKKIKINEPRKAPVDPQEPSGYGYLTE